VEVPQDPDRVIEFQQAAEEEGLEVIQVDELSLEVTHGGGETIEIFLTEGGTTGGDVTTVIFCEASA
jgi:hypothetical protein